jgi:DNA-binding response OmpR family regulator
MPIMDGATMVVRMREIDPTVKVLAVSSHEEWPKDVERLSKPFDLDELLHKIQSCA